MGLCATDERTLLIEKEGSASADPSGLARRDLPDPAHAIPSTVQSPIDAFFLRRLFNDAVVSCLN